MWWIAGSLTPIFQRFSTYLRSNICHSFLLMLCWLDLILSKTSDWMESICLLNKIYRCYSRMIWTTFLFPLLEVVKGRFWLWKLLRSHISRPGDVFKGTFHDLFDHLDFGFIHLPSLSSTNRKNSILVVLNGFILSWVLF